MFISLNMKNVIITILLAVFVCSCKVTRKKLTFQNVFDATKNNNTACYRIPSMVTAKNGDLILAIDERVPHCGDLKNSKDINIVLRRSTDNGKTWSPIQKIIDFPFGESASDPSMVVDKKTGNIFMFYNYMNLKTEKDVYYFHVIKSSDNGKTWSKPQDITKNLSKEGWQNDFKFITSGQGIQTKSGRLLHCLVNLSKGLFVFESNNHGKSWNLLENSVGKVDESKIIELANNQLMVNSRVNKKGSRSVFISSDKGISWQEQKNTQQLIDPSCNASIIRYTSKKDGFNKNRLLFVNPKSGSKRENLTVRISYDEGKTWSEGKTIYKGESAYSTLTILKNGDIGLFFEKDGYTKNVFTSFSLEWLTNGKDEYIDLQR